MKKMFFCSLIFLNTMLTACGSFSEIESEIIAQKQPITELKTESETLEQPQTITELKTESETLEQPQTITEMESESMTEPPSAQVDPYAQANDDAKKLYDDMAGVLNAFDLTITGSYMYGDSESMDYLLEGNITIGDEDIFNRYDVIGFYLFDGNVASASCKKGSVFGGYPTNYDLSYGENFNLFSAMDNDGKAKYCNNTAYQIGVSLDCIFFDMGDDSPAEGDYEIHEFEDIYSRLSDYIHLYIVDECEVVKYRVFTTESGNKQSAVLVGFDGKHFGGYPCKADASNTELFTLDDAQKIK